jgi:signal peptidase I
MPILLRYALQSLGLTFIVAALVRIFLVSSVFMGGHSMIPSLLPGDFLVGKKWDLGTPERGEIFLLRCPQNGQQACIRRVVALQGDRVEVTDAGVLINGKAIERKRKGPFAEESVGGRQWGVWPDKYKSKQALIVPPQHVFVLNDRRSDEADSRTWGPISADLLEARMARVWLSLDWFESDGKVRAWPRVRRERMFRSIN